MFGDAPLAEEAIASLLVDEWQIGPAEVRYEPVGYGSYHWAAAAGGGRWFVTADEVAGPRPAVECYRLARRLADDGLDVVRPPVRARSGDVACECDGWWVSVWPWLEGRTSAEGRHQTDADVEAVAGAVRRLHDHPAGPPAAPLVEDWAIAGWARLEASLADARAGDGPYAPGVRALLADRTGYVLDMKARYDDLVAGRRPGPGWVVTHGEPHAANVVHTAAGAVLIDWDTVRWAPRERDLWMLSWYPTWRRGYGDGGVDEGLLQAYRLQWDLAEIALFVPDLLAASQATPDLDVAMEELAGYLAG